ITKYSTAAISPEAGKKTAMFACSSTVAAERRAPATPRDIPAPALQFYTAACNSDPVATNTPASFSADAMHFSALTHAVKRDPRPNVRSANNKFDFWSSLPEALHQVTIIMSDRGIPKSFRHMHGFGSHTFSMINADNERVWVKFHMRTQ